MNIRKYVLELNDEKTPTMELEEEYACNVTEVNSPAVIAEMLETCFRLRHKAEEYFVLICVNRKLHPVAVFEVAHGGGSHCQISPKEIFTRALLCGTNGIIVAHNHPSGYSSPSQCDINTCERIKSAAELIGIHLIDFVIVGRDTYSFKEREDLI